MYVAAWTHCDKKRTTRWAWPYNSVSLAVWQLGCATVTAWLLDCLTALQLDRQLGCLTVWPYNSCSLTAWQRGLAASAAWLLDSLAACRAGNPKNMQPSLDQTSTRPLNISFQRSGSTPLERSGSGVWIRDMDRLWDRGLIQTWHFEPQPYEHMCSVSKDWNSKSYQSTLIWKVKQQKGWTHSANGPWDKSLNFIFPTKHVIPESLKFIHCLSEWMLSVHRTTNFKMWHSNHCFSKNFKENTKTKQQFHCEGMILAKWNNISPT